MNEIESKAGEDTLYEENKTRWKTAVYLYVCKRIYICCTNTYACTRSISIHKTRAIIKALYSNHQAPGCLMTKQRIDNGPSVYNHCT